MEKLSKILSIDFGSKTIGIAISDNEKKYALPLCEIPNDINKFNKIIEILKEDNISLIIVGFPKTNNGYVSERHAIIKEFKSELDKAIASNNINIETIFFDESYSTKSSYDSLKSFNIKTSKLSKNKDMIAASIILENYLTKLRLY